MTRLLIVDDDPACRRMLEHYLAPVGQCDSAADGGEAIDAVRKALETGIPYDLVFMDLMMPGRTGHETLRCIREIEAERGVSRSESAKVIMTTAVCDVEQCVQAYREGFESYLTKPIDPVRLFQRVRELGLLTAAVATGERG